MTGISTESRSGPSRSRLQQLVHRGRRGFNSRVNRTIQFERPGWLSTATEEVGPVNSKPSSAQASIYNVSKPSVIHEFKGKSRIFLPRPVQDQVPRFRVSR